VQGTLMDACNTLLGLVDDLLDTPLLSLSGIKVAMDLAAKTTPAASAIASIGALKVGNLTVVDANDLVALGGQLNAAINTVESTLGSVFGATGLDLPNPALALLDVTKSKGRNAAGTYFAKAALTVARLYIPAAVVDVPAVPNNVDVLKGLGGFAPASVKMAAVSTPVVSVEAGVFSGAATFKGSSSGSTAPGQLPTTGVGNSALAFAGMLTLIGAGFLRRVSKNH
jgi:LPXTG-motif cell wall-anchored protein